MGLRWLASRECRSYYTGKQGKDSGGQMGPKFWLEGTEMPMSPNISEIFNKIILRWKLPVISFLFVQTLKHLV